MAQKISYMCDGGSLMVGNETIQFFIQNGYGDGRFTATVLGPDEAKKRPENTQWYGVFSGKGLRVYHYDCGPQFGYTEIPDGRYFAYNRTADGNIWLVRSRDELMEMNPAKDRLKKLAWTLAYDINHMAREYEGYREILGNNYSENADMLQIDDCIRAIQSELLNNTEKVGIYKEILSRNVDESKFIKGMAKSIIERIDDLEKELGNEN